MPRPVVLTMHPNTEGIWRTLVPDAEGAEVFHVDSPPGGWQRNMNHDEWDRVYDSLLMRLREVQRSPGAHLHVLASGPYALGLLLGYKREDHTPLSVYQNDRTMPKGKEWVCWGPRGQSAPDDAGPVFLPVERLPRNPRPDIGNVAVVIDIAKPIFDAVDQSLGGLGLPDAVALRVQIPEPGKVFLPATMANAADAELRAIVDEIRRLFPTAHLHLFYSGPLALIIRIGTWIHIGGRQITFYEFDNQGAYHPYIRIPGGLPLWRPDALARKAPMTLRYLPEQETNSRAGGHLFNIEQININPIPLTVEPPDAELVKGLAWLLNERLNQGPADPDNRTRAETVERALGGWSEGAGRALSNALGGAAPGPIELALPGPGRPVTQWPWEWMKLPTGEPLGAVVPIWRSLPPTVRRAALAGPLSSGPLRVLLAIARGSSKDTRDDVGYRNVARALLEVAGLPDRALEVEVLPRPCTLAALSRRLHDRSRPVHLLHIDGHGEAGRMCLEDNLLCSKEVTAEELANAVAGASLRAVVLNACHSAEGADGAPLDDLAVALHRRGVPAVVGMQAAARVDAAMAFSWAFYESLTRTGRIDLATMEGRAALARTQERDCQGSSFTLPDWGVPVLYLWRGGEALRDPWPMERATPSSRPPSRAPMDWMLQQLDRALATSADGALLLHGTIGSGKSALLKEAAEWWRRAWGVGVRVQFVEGAIPATAPAPGAEALARLREVRGALRDVAGERILVWDDLDRARPWSWSVEERRALADEIEDLTDAGERLVLASRDRLRWLQRVHRLPMEGLRPREARELGRAWIKARPDARLSGAATALEAVGRAGEIAASNAACLNAMLRAVVEGWTPMALDGLRRQDLPDACQPVYEALDASLATVRSGLSLGLLSGMRVRIVRGRAELRVDQVDARLGGPLDLLERAGALSLWPNRSDAVGVRYRIHPLLPVWFNEQIAGI